MKILIVEDNPRLVDRVKRKLNRNFAMDAAEDGSEALRKIQTIDYSVIILDLGLPDMTGLDVCRKTRGLAINTPILVLTGIDDTESRVQLLDAGADDYITKPFEPDELRARINALARRRARREPEPKITYDTLVIDREQRKVFRENKQIDLRRKEFDILEYLVSNQGRVLTRDMIMNHVWDADKISWKSTVDVHIKHLRDKIDRPFDKQIIKTSYGLGYHIEPLE